VPLAEQELLTLPEHVISPPVFSGVRVTRFAVLCVCFDLNSLNTEKRGVMLKMEVRIDI
jgi:hypothetical protein